MRELHGVVTTKQQPGVGATNGDHETSGRWGSARSDKVAGPGLARMIPPDPRLTTGESLSAVEPIGRRPRDLRYRSGSTRDDKSASPRLRG